MQKAYHLEGTNDFHKTFFCNCQSSICMKKSITIRCFWLDLLKGILIWINLHLKVFLPSTHLTPDTNSSFLLSILYCSFALINLIYSLFIFTNIKKVIITKKSNMVKNHHFFIISYTFLSKQIYVHFPCIFLVTR